MKVQIRNGRQIRLASNLILPASDAEIRRVEKELKIKEPTDTVTLVKEYKGNPVMERLAGKEVNLDELNFLAKRLDSLTDYEQRKMSAYADIIKIQSVKDFINLTYNLSGLTLIDEFLDSKENGKRIFMDKFGGISESELETWDFETLAEETMQRAKTKVTKLGVLIDHGMVMEQVYHGRTFPEFYDSAETVAGVAIQNQTGDTEFLYLPANIVSINKAKARLGVKAFEECSILDIQNRRLPEKIFQELEPIKMLKELTLFNELCQKVVSFDEKKMTQLQMASEYAGAKESTSIVGIAEYLDSFEIYPELHNDAEYGKFMITESKLFEVDESLLPYIDFEGFAKHRREKDLTESGFVQNGFVGATRSVTEMTAYAGEFSDLLESREEGLETLRIYSPLHASLYGYGDENDDAYSLTGSEIAGYEEEIKSAIEEDIGEEARGLMHYFDECRAVAAKVIAAFPKVETYQGELYGVLECKIKEDLTKEEQSILEEFWIGQMADGWGEGFEQREVSVEEGDLYVSFWGHGNYILSEEKLKGSEEEQGMEIKMGM